MLLYGLESSRLALTTPSEVIQSARSKTRYGFDTAEWQVLRERTREVLLHTAVERRTITYGDLAASISGGRISPRSAALAALLGEVCESEDAQSGTLTGSLVVRTDTGIPGDGYFRHTGVFDAGTRERRDFWQAQVERVWDAYPVSK